ncbi:G-type lectin S-receptor-like serine/threonine-protein kinase [Morus notabilis]|uniref:non-specific serine/threonine protein kinase n=1 Tax=Morus notabilis TaxID=981085 RepID=W9RMV6_9ROSA|nr:G-type lectin S-receptor-like serine/threonine-protein kinase [Morus notabilis]
MTAAQQTILEEYRSLDAEGNCIGQAYRSGTYSLTPDGMISYGNLSSSTTEISQCNGDYVVSGCAEQQLPVCRSRSDKIELLQGRFLEDKSNSTWYVDGNSSINLSDCWDRCWKNCSCVGFETFNLDETGCQKKEESILKELTNSEGFNNTEEIIGFDGKKGKDLKLFSFASILAATENFSPENKLGQGGFGPVFKGKLLEGQEIAVKRLSRSSLQGLVEFKNELILIAKLQHLHLVRLLDCCVRGDEKMLINEYMPNKSLDFFLFDPTRRELLDWKKHYNVIEGIAQGLLYLHRYSRLRIIHKDLKASNILLDKDMNPKISDFVVTCHWSMPWREISSDIYSFGVLLLEIVSGRRNTGFYSPECSLNLVGYAWELWKEGSVTELIDSTLLADYSARPQIVRCIRVGLLCLQDCAADRPTMADVLQMIFNQSVPLPVPKRVSVPFQLQMHDSNSYGTNQESSSVPTSITVFEPGLSHAQKNNTIKPGQVLFSSEKLLVSANGRFQFGFFNVSVPPCLAGMDFLKEGGSVSRPPLLDGSNYLYWKASMKAFIKAIDEKAHKAVLTSWEHPVTKDSEGKEILKPETTWSTEEDKLANNNSKALNVFFNGVDANQFKLISTCEIAKDAWETLQMTHEGTATMRLSKLQILTTRFENLRMQEDEIISEFNSRLCDIAN